MDKKEIWKKAGVAWLHIKAGLLQSAGDRLFI